MGSEYGNANLIEGVAERRGNSCLVQIVVGYAERTREASKLALLISFKAINNLQTVAVPYVVPISNSSGSRRYVSVVSPV